MAYRYTHSSAFTIVELLVVVVIIAVLAAISLVMYSGISQKALSSVLQSDLSNASTALKAFQVEKSNFPTTVSTNCSTNPDTDTNKCLSLSGGNMVVGYSANNSSIPKTFTLVVSNKATTGPNSQTYRVTDSTNPTQLANTMQPGVTPGAVLELHAARADGGIGPGVNSPLTTTWYDTSGNGNNGTLANFGGSQTSGWSGSGTALDPYRLSFTLGDLSNRDIVSTNALVRIGSQTHEAWVRSPSSTTYKDGLLFTHRDSQTGGAFLPRGVSGGQTQPLLYLNGSNFRYWENGSWQTDGEWHHIIVIISGELASDISSSYLYVDNVVQSPTQTYLSSNPLSYAFGVRLGHTNYITDSIAVFRAYPFALTPEQITANYNAGTEW